MKACIFDLDGTLFRSVSIWERVDEEYLSRRGIALPVGFRQDIAVMSFPEAAAYTIERFHLDETPQALMKEWKDIAVEGYMKRVELKPHAAEYLQLLHDKGLKLGIATSAAKSLFEPILIRCGIRALFSVFCTTETSGVGKSQPDIYLDAARQLGEAPADCCVFEDSLEAMGSAKRAGMTVYGICEPEDTEQRARVEAVADGVVSDYRNAPEF